MNEKNWPGELCAAVKNERKLLESLAAAAEEKSGALERADIARIDALVNAEQALTAQLGAAGARREELLRACGLDGMTLAQLTVRAGGAAGEMAGELAKLRAAAGRLREANAVNGRISRVRLDFYRYLSARAGRAQGENEKGTYGSSGRLRGEERGNALIDTRA